MMRDAERWAKEAYEIRTVEHIGEFRLRLTFADGLVFELDLTDKLNGPVGQVFEPLRDPKFFAQAAVDPELGRSCGLTAPTWRLLTARAGIARRLNTNGPGAPEVPLPRPSMDAVSGTVSPKNVLSRAPCTLPGRHLPAWPVRRRADGGEATTFATHGGYCD